jgi:hypothetical protein
VVSVDAGRGRRPPGTPIPARRETLIDRRRHQRSSGYDIRMTNPNQDEPQAEAQTERDADDERTISGSGAAEGGAWTAEEQDRRARQNTGEPPD